MNSNIKTGIILTMEDKYHKKQMQKQAMPQKDATEIQTTYDDYVESIIKLWTTY